MKLGVCFFPEHLPFDDPGCPSLAETASHMRELGIRVVRMGEFSWHHVQPTRDAPVDLSLFVAACDAFLAEGIEVVMCTPTATPPKWLMDEFRDPEPGWDPSSCVDNGIAFAEDGRPRLFGSRRHYCFSSSRYRRAAVAVATQYGEALGKHPAVVAWQVDNEYGCHDTAASYSPMALAGFREYLRGAHDGNIADLNARWGTAFWSMAYNSFDEIELPNLTVTEPCPAHVMAFWRYTSSAVAAFHRAQVDVLRDLSPGRRICHNVMGTEVSFDHYELGAECDFVGWDSYPLGFLQQQPRSVGDVGGDGCARHRARYHRVGDPDFQAFHHDLYAAVTSAGLRGGGGGGRNFWVIEQQPGPVNWAPSNSAPMPGAVRLWTLEAMAHGCEALLYFRWRRYPRAQEMQHAAILRPDGREDSAASDLRTTSGDVAAILAAAAAAEGGGTDGGQVFAGADRGALFVFDYASCYAASVQPQGHGGDPLAQLLLWYRALRRLGFTVDFADAAGREEDLLAQFDAHAIVVCPRLTFASAALSAAVSRAAPSTVFVFGPRLGSRDRDFAIPAELAPGEALRDTLELAPFVVAREESLPASITVGVEWCDHSEERALYAAESASPIVATPVDAGAGAFAAVSAEARRGFVEWFEHGEPRPSAEILATTQISAEDPGGAASPLPAVVSSACGRHISVLGVPTERFASEILALAAKRAGVPDSAVGDGCGNPLPRSLRRRGITLGKHRFDFWFNYDPTLCFDISKVLRVDDDGADISIIVGPKNGKLGPASVVVVARS